MTGAAGLIAAVLVTGWFAERVAVLILPARAPRHWATVAGYGAAAAAGWIGGYGFGLLIAAISPVGALVPALCLAWSLKRLGLLDLRDVPVPDLLAFALLCALVLAGAAGLFPVNPYAWFYGGTGAALLPAGLALWAVWRAQIAVLFGVVIAQGSWLADIGSSNLYDQLSHPLLPLVLLAVAGARALDRLLAKHRQPDPDS